MVRIHYRREKPCECGSKLYGYKDMHNSRIYLCYSCGKYNGKDVPDNLYSLIQSEPLLILSMLEIGYLTPIK